MTTQVTLDPAGSDDPLLLEVDFVHHRPRRGARDSLLGIRGAGPPLEPDDPEDLEILSVTDLATGADLALSRSDEDRVTEACWLHLQELAEVAWDRE